MEKETAKRCTRGALYWLLGKISSLKGLSSPGAGCPGVAIPGGIYKVCKCGTEGHSLVLDLDKQLDLFLKVFSNLKHSVILYIVTADAPTFP